MQQIIIDKKKYVLLPEKEYLELQKKTAFKTQSQKLLSVKEARAYSKRLIKVDGVKACKITLRSLC